MSNTYCLSVDGAGVGTITQNKCTVPAPGGPVPSTYLLGPVSTDPNAQANCASTDSTTGVQTFSKGACANSTDLTFYSYASPTSGETPLCFSTAPTGVQGTVVTLIPSQSGCSMNLNFKYQNVTCADTGCGDHGTCTNGQCTCSDNWTGVQCEKPPQGNAGCVPDTDSKKSCGNQGSYGTCQAASSSTTGITGSGSCTCDLMTGQQGTYCEQHCSANDGTSCGGPLRGYCVDNFYNYYTNSNAVKKRCVCVNGWSGVDCSVPPPNWKCTADTDCTNLTTQDPKDTVPTGTCNNGTCACNNSQDCTSSNTQGSAFTGVACQTPLPTQGAACKVDGDCTSPLTCVGGSCTCPGGNTPQPSDSFILKIIQMMVGMVTTAEGWKNLSGILVAQSALPLAIKWMTTKALEAGFVKTIESRLTKGVTGSLLGAEAKQILEQSVGKRLAAKVLAKMTTKELVECTVSSAASKVAAEAFTEVFGFVGKIESFANFVQIIGMVLDAADVMGLNEESSQSQIDATLQKINGAVNSNKTILSHGLYFPAKQTADTTFPFLQQTLTTASRNQFAIDAGNYLSHLAVNSNGAAIIPMFQTPVQQQQAALQAEAQGSVLYTLAGKNLDVYSRLKQDWPIIVAGILVAIGVLVGSAFGIKALVNKKKLAINK